MFENLTNRLSSAFSSLRGKKELTPENVEEGLEAVRAALLEGDVHFRVARDLVDRVRTRVLGKELLKGVEPSQQFVHAVHTELVELMGQAAYDILVEHCEDFERRRSQLTLHPASVAAGTLPVKGKQVGRRGTRR